MTEEIVYEHTTFSKIFLVVVICVVMERSLYLCFFTGWSGQDDVLAIRIYSRDAVIVGG